MKFTTPIPRLAVVAMLSVLAVALCSCGILNPPSQSIGYQIINQPDSQPTIQVASNGAQTTGLYGGTITPGENGNSGPIFGNSVGGDASRSTDADIEASIQRDNRQTTQAQSRDQSPQTTSADARDGRQAEVATAVGEVATANAEGAKPDAPAPAEGK